MLPILPYIFCALLSVAVFALWRKLEVARASGAALAVAEAAATQLRGELELQKARAETVEAAKDELQKKLSESEKQQALAEQNVRHAEARMAEFEQLKAQFEQYAKAAALETGNQLSNKLLTDHQRAREETHKQFEQFTKLASEQLLQKQTELATHMGQLKGQMDDSRKELGVLVRAMQNPIGAGAEGEIVMSNILQQHGFTAGLDYDLQVHMVDGESNLRPDCVIYLPHQHAIIIDSKASQHIFALFRSEGTPEFDAAFRDIQASMRSHAKALAGKAYRDSLKKLHNSNKEPFTRTTMVMFIPNDEVVTRLMQKDPNLMQYLRENDIVLAGPVTLSGIFLTARALIREARQQDEQQAIFEMVQALMGDIIMSMKHADKVIGGIRNSASAFDQFSASINRGLGRMRKLTAKGLLPAKNAAIPANLPRYDISKADDVVNAESEEMAEVLSITKEDAA